MFLQTAAQSNSQHLQYSTAITSEASNSKHTLKLLETSFRRRPATGTRCTSPCQSLAGSRSATAACRATANDSRTNQVILYSSPGRNIR